MGRMPAAERREQLLDVAAEAFSAQGYARATTSQGPEEIWMATLARYDESPACKDDFRLQ